MTVRIPVLGNFHKLKDRIYKVAWITFFWTLISILQFFMTFSVVVQLDLNLIGIAPKEFLTSAVITGLLAGIFGGSTIVFFWEKWLRSMSYRWSLINIWWSFTLVYFIVSIVGGLFLYSDQLNLSLFHAEVLNSVSENWVGWNQISNYIFWLLVVLLTLIALLVNDKYGPGVFTSFLLGKYFQPQREERIFMFLDLRGSTSIAERLGERKYFSFLKDLFKDVTPGILKTKGEIYQYVGDEIVISWKNEVGTTRANCIQCYLNIKQILLERATYYQKNYNGEVPEFKAGLHSGFVMVGEIGIVKREIAYSGDVLNTTARIQSKCNDLGVNILLSRHLLERIKGLPDSFKSKAIGEIELRGKQQVVMLYTIAS